ncbi:MCE family protein [Nocardia sp. NPDC004582]
MVQQQGGTASPIGSPFVQKPAPKRYLDQGWVIRLAGAGLVLGLVAVVVFCLVSFAGGFTNTALVTVNSPRAGLVMDRDAKVKIRGVEIGRVKSIDETPEGARIELSMDPDKLKLVPANATVDINSTTVFGAKYINFIEPQNPSGQLRAGAVVQADGVTVEFNTLFQHLSDVLNKVQPEKLNATLTALGTALQGRGEKLGLLLSDSDEFLKQINPSLPTLQEDLRKTASVTGTYADTVGDLLRVTDNMQVTGKTITDEQARVDDLLTNLIGLADTSNSVLKPNENDLIKSLNLLRPTTDLLFEYRSALYCTIMTFGMNVPLMDELIGGRYPAFAMNAGIMPSGTPYSFPEDLPKVNATGGPHCENTYDLTGGQKANYLMTDTSEGHIWAPPTQPHASKTVFEILFDQLPGVGKK